MKIGVGKDGKENANARLVGRNTLVQVNQELLTLHVTFLNVTWCLNFMIQEGCELIMKGS